ncbi:MAG: winged helix-turn-helix transcriptional regulator [Brevundimonas sp.]|uniref:winged helix-turn-helix transcriptional regulator n=1 Tax=Brevundimonas sp. TaxID=1871086 RepID=UPI00391DECCF
MKLEKITKQSGRVYNDACGTAHGLELIGERWALLVVRELMLGPKRFGDLKADLMGISANVLTQRLERLEAVGIVTRRKLPPPASVQVYDLTDWGREAEPIIMTLGRWAARSPGHDPTLPLSGVSMMLSLRTMIDSEKAGDLRLDAGFLFGDETYRAQLADGELVVARGEVEGADFAITAAPEMTAAAVYGDQPLTAMEAAGALTVTGDKALAQRFIDLYALPPKAALQVRDS